MPCETFRTEATVSRCEQQIKTNFWLTFSIQGVGFGFGNGILSFLLQVHRIEVFYDLNKRSTSSNKLQKRLAHYLDKINNAAILNVSLILGFSPYINSICSLTFPSYELEIWGEKKV